jgi:hypothetical protein
MPCSWSHAGTWINRYRKYYCRAAAQSFLVNFGEKIHVVPMWHAFAFLSGLSATLTLPDYGRVARDTDTIRRIISKPLYNECGDTAFCLEMKRLQRAFDFSQHPGASLRDIKESEGAAQPAMLHKTIYSIRNIPSITLTPQPASRTVLP